MPLNTPSPEIAIIHLRKRYHLLSQSVSTQLPASPTFCSINDLPEINLLIFCTRNQYITKSFCTIKVIHFNSLNIHSHIHERDEGVCLSTVSKEIHLYQNKTCIRVIRTSKYQLYTMNLSNH